MRPLEPAERPCAGPGPSVESSVSLSYLDESPLLKRMQSACDDAQLRDPAPDCMTRIMPNVLLSGEHAAQNMDALAKENVTHVICCFGIVSEAHQSACKCLAIPIEDEPYYPVLQHVDQIQDFLRTLKGDRCLVYCRMGRNRSAALAIALLMRAKRKKQQVTDYERLLQSSWELVTRRHGRVLTNYGFQRQLLLYAHNGCRWSNCWGPEVWLALNVDPLGRAHRLGEAVIAGLSNADEAEDEQTMYHRRSVAARFVYEWMKRRQQCLTPSQYKLRINQSRTPVVDTG